MKILLVDDDMLEREMLFSIFSEFGQVDQAADGQAAVNMFQDAVSGNESYDLVCLDIIMPLVDGRKVLSKIREADAVRGLRTKVFVISACSATADIEDAFFDGDCDDYIVKPFRREFLIQMLERHNLI